MRIIDHGSAPVEEWRPGVRTRMRVSALGQAHQLCIFEQWCETGLGAPTHLHSVEEVLEVISGSAEIWIGPDKAEVGPDQSVIVPAGQLHGFRNVGETELHVRATLAAPVFEASYSVDGEISRRWVPEP